MSRRLTPAAALLLGLTLALLAACQGEGSRPEAPARQPGADRIVALTPSVTETLFALGLGERVVGVSDYSTWPPEVKSKPRLGGLFNPNLERMVALDPDLAILIPSEHDLGEKLRGLGVDTLTVQNESLADVEKSIHVISRRCGVPEAGDRLTAEWRKGLAPRPLVAPGGKRPRVLISVGRPAGRLTDLLIAGPGTFLDELLTRLGAENVFADAGSKWPQIPLEEVMARAPDVILEVRVDELSPQVKEELKRDWDGLPGLPATQGGRIEVIDGDHTVIPGPRLPQVYADMAAALAKHVEAR